MTEFCRNKVSLYQERLNGNIKSSETLMAAILLNVPEQYSNVVSQLLLKDGVTVEEIEATLREWELLSKNDSDENPHANMVKEVQSLKQKLNAVMKAKGMVKGKSKAVRKRCSHCQKTGHTRDKCFKLHPNLLKEFREKLKAKKAKKKAGSDIESNLVLAGSSNESLDQSPDQGCGDAESSVESLSVISADLSTEAYVGIE